MVNKKRSKITLIVNGIFCGAAIAFVDNFAIGGEVSPILIVLLLLLFSSMAGILWGRRGWMAAISGWIIIPLVHLLKHIFNLPDTIYPNTYASIFWLAAFTLVMMAIGFGCGMILRKMIKP